MNAVHQPAFAHLIPTREATTRDLAAHLVSISSVLSCHTLSEGERDRLEDMRFDAEQAFYAALKRETGMDRDLFQMLVGVL